MQLTKGTGMCLPWRWASCYNAVACLYIIPTNMLSISMADAMLGKFYQYKDNKGTNLPLYENMQVMSSLGESTFQCLLLTALVIRQWLTDEVIGTAGESWFGRFFVGVSKYAEEK